MTPIKLLFIENVINRQDSIAYQELSFLLLVENLGYEKEVEIHWSGEQGIWQVMKAEYRGLNGQNKELWMARQRFELTDEQSLPGNIECCAKLLQGLAQSWDNQDGNNYFSQADSGVILTNQQVVQNITHINSLLKEQKHLRIGIAIDKNVPTDKVSIHWTRDRWETMQIETCEFNTRYWDQQIQSNARNPNQYGCSIWSADLVLDETFRLEYAICYELDGHVFWENNQGINFSLQREELKIMILNLHCYQEENQDQKFSLIAEAINQMDIDLVCFQEVAEYWNHGEGDWESNSANIINQRLNQSYHIHTDWSHLGFSQYREGVAILSRYPLTYHESRYVSVDQDIFSIHSRKVVKARAYIPFVGYINVFSAHLSWIEDGFVEQFQTLHEWAEACNDCDINATLLCGDFNITAGSEGYKQVVDSQHYEDQYLAANEQGIFEQIFRVNDEHWQHLLTDDYRIDYIFMNTDSRLKVTSARVVFTDDDFGRVSDHCGYVMSFEPK